MDTEMALVGVASSYSVSYPGSTLVDGNYLIWSFRFNCVSHISEKYKLTEYPALRLQIVANHLQSVAHVSRQK